MAYPPWLQEPLLRDESRRHSPAARRLARRLASLRLQTVCQSARCPNQGQCWSQGTATFLILGTSCTRGCRFCHLHPGRPEPVDEDEPWRLLQAVRELGLRHVVITSVTRDDLPDGGATAFATAIQVVRRGASPLLLEILTPDFQGYRPALEIVAAAQPDLWGHNLETVPRLYPQIRPGAEYHRSLELLAISKKLAPACLTKSGLMLGLGETPEEIMAVLADLRQAGVDHLTLGQYLAPSRRHAPVSRYLTPAEFAAWGRYAQSLGFASSPSGPLVSSSLP
ncbi:MAG: lipoyl synthase, partial [Desulfobacca sp.]|uniref:lipoyl synthase n=1 Tax=Desulfobacca sp. TaxID=2067990 RepID=UPI0040499047